MENPTNLPVDQSAETDSAAEILAVLRQQLATGKRQTRLSLITLCLTAVMLIVLAASAVIIVPPALKAVSTINTEAANLREVTSQISSLATQVSKEVDQIDVIVTKAKWEMDEISTMVTSITKTSQNLDKLVTDNTKTINESVEKISKIDFETLNKAIQDLATSVEPLANFARLFQRD
ncbi:MAG: hypothetical protein II795_06580 [Firmicutes bacterium]|nr:hypothetical protein [Bacillota bacterium]